MNTNKSATYLHKFSWEEWDNQMIVVIYRDDRRFVVKRYIERVLSNSPKWQQLAKSSFSNVTPIQQAYTMTENEVKLMHQIFSWHFNGTLTFPIIGGLDQLFEWEDVLDFIERVEQTSKNTKQDASTTQNSPAMIATIPVGSILTKRPNEKMTDLENLEPTKRDLTPIKINRKAVRQQQQQVVGENLIVSSTKNQWVQINNICVPYIIKSIQTRLLPYQVLIDCNLFNQQEQLFLQNLTIKANTNDIQIFQSIISSSTSINFTLNSDLLLIDLYHLIFGMSKVVYVKLLNNQRDVNKSYKTVLAQCGGTLKSNSHSIPFISLGKYDYILFDSLVNILQITKKIMPTLRRHTLVAQSQQIEYLRLIQFYHKNSQNDDYILSNQQQEQLLISTKNIQKYINENDLIIDMLLTQYQQTEYQKLRKQIESMDSKSVKKPTKRKATTAITELHNTTTTTKQ